MLDYEEEVKQRHRSRTAEGGVRVGTPLNASVCWSDAYPGFICADGISELSFTVSQPNNGDVKPY